MPQSASQPLINASPKRITLLGATGTIGENTLDIIRHSPDKFTLFAASAHKNLAAMQRIIAEFRPNYVTMSDYEALQALKQSPEAALTTVLDTENSLSELAALPCDMLVHGIVGASGIAPLYQAVENGHNIALANKESLVCAGHLLMPKILQKGLDIYPVDSEHSAIFQLLKPLDTHAVESVTLTASGGPFLHTALADFPAITPEKAVKHPNWVMGAKISIDSATMANKGLEVIEAHYLFGLPVEKLQVVIHPESIIHGMVSLCDGAMLAHLSTPDMRTPIAYAMHGGEYQKTPATKLDFTQVASLHFMPVEAERFPLFSLCINAMKAGPAHMICLNASNEIAVQAFLERRIPFTAISALVAHMLESCTNRNLPRIEDVLTFDKECRIQAQQQVIQQC